MNRKLEEKMNKIKALSDEELCKMFNCKPNKICRGDYIARHTDDKVCPYKVIFGFANFEGSQVESLGDLEVVFGRKLVDENGEITDMAKKPIYLGLNVANSKIRNFGKVKQIYGSLDIGDKITSLANIEFLGSNLYLNRTRIKSLENVQEIHGRLNLEECILESFGACKKASYIYFDCKTLKDLADFEMAKKIVIAKTCSPEVIKLLRSSLKESKGKIVRKGLNTSI